MHPIGASQVVLPMVVSWRDQRLSVFSTIAVFGAPHDLELRGLDSVAAFDHWIGACSRRKPLEAEAAPVILPACCAASKIAEHEFTKFTQQVA